MNTTQVLRQRAWTEEELRASRLKYYAPRKKLVMARLVEVPVEVKKTIDVLSARKGDIMIYDPGDGQPQQSLDHYEHWPIRADLFRKTYKVWDDVKWQPTPAESHLLAHGCRPYYKHKGVWALHLTSPVYIQSLESKKPVKVPPGRWLVIGSEGEPYHLNDNKFRERYQV